MNNLLKEYVQYLIQEQLEEDKFQDAVKANPEFAPYLEKYFKGIKPKYLPWIVKQAQYVEKDRLEKNRSQEWTAYALKKLRFVLDDFEKLLPKIKQKDITQYQDTDEVMTTIQIANQPSETELRKIAKSNSEKIYEDENFLIIEPLNKEASVYYGKGTKWCISGLVDNMFDEYFITGTPEDGPLEGVWFLFDKQTNKKYAITFGSMEYKDVQVYNAEDEHVRHSFIARMLPQRVVDLLNNKAGMEVFDPTMED